MTIQHATLKTSEHSINQLKQWLKLYNSNLKSREDQIHFEVLTAQDIGKQLEMMVNNHHVQTQLRRGQLKNW